MPPDDVLDLTPKGELILVSEAHDKLLQHLHDLIDIADRRDSGEDWVEGFDRLVAEVRDTTTTITPLGARR